jgi:rhodanese-related sulfurtransferase
MAQLSAEPFPLTAEELRSRFRKGEAIFMVNLRHHGDWDVGILNARGALRIADDELEKHLEEIPKGREVVILYSGPGDRPSYDAAELLNRKGWKNVHPLRGGFKAYLEAGLPVVERETTAKKKMLLSGS